MEGKIPTVQDYLLFLEVTKCFWILFSVWLKTLELGCRGPTQYFFFQPSLGGRIKCYWSLLARGSIFMMWCYRDISPPKNLTAYWGAHLKTPLQCHPAVWWCRVTKARLAIQAAALRSPLRWGATPTLLSSPKLGQSWWEVLEEFWVPAWLWFPVDGTDWWRWGKGWRGQPCHGPSDTGWPLARVT